jgi:GTPase-activating protein BEM2
MISELTQDAVYRTLPPGVRSCVRAYGIVRKWLLSKIVASRIGTRIRQQRMDLLLRAIEVARLRSTGVAGAHPQPCQRPCIRSFVETALTSAIVSVESRMYHRAWQNVAIGRGVQCDSLSSLLSKPRSQSTASFAPFTMDMSWLLERLLEVICTPDLVEPLTQEGQNLINFDKRRYVVFII